ncbi:MAG: (deoxy)nucleoside triphosphate pyrophosphohydrolase [Oscillospiraceae bacterium]|nr:(deoxy)nucleoside triphosphate pyrophosphohydrolase [Oscillospiraceae bacterium]
MKHIKVVAGILRQGDRVYATQRGYGPQKDGWEFPGGKLEPGESPREALRRELREELAVEIRVEDYLTTLEYDYPEFHLSMDCYFASVTAGSLTLLEHEAARWLSPEQLDSLDWLPADRELLPLLKRRLGGMSSAL